MPYKIEKTNAKMYKDFVWQGKKAQRNDKTNKRRRNEHAWSLVKNRSDTSNVDTKLVNIIRKNPMIDKESISTMQKCLQN